MISFEEAYQRVMSHTFSFGMEHMDLLRSTNRVLAEDIFADRNFPPFNRSTKDGIAINSKGLEGGNLRFPVSGIIPAGTPPPLLKDTGACYEIMTGAVVPENADTVVMYEDLDLVDGYAVLKSLPEVGKNIHQEGSDEKSGNLLLSKNRKISGAEVGILAAVGKSQVLVHKNPVIATISTGNELVEINEIPEPHQIRQSNTASLRSLLLEENISAENLHVNDERGDILSSLELALKKNDVLLLSGGVSKGKFDFIPESLDKLGVKKVFHRVLQRPGKPFWFGLQEQHNTVVFSFPGNPVSTFANYHIYFRDWLYKSWGLDVPEFMLELGDSTVSHDKLTIFSNAKVRSENGIVKVFVIGGNGSGDLISLGKTDGFVRLDPGKGRLEKGTLVPFIPTRNLLNWNR